MNRLLPILMIVIATLGFSPGAFAQDAAPETLATQDAPLVVVPSAAEVTAAPTLESLLAGDNADPDSSMSTAVEIALLLTVLSLLPAVLITITSFTRIVIVLSFVRRALSVNELPPNPVIIGLALFLTMFVMAPVGTDIYEEAWVPHRAGEISTAEAGDTAWNSLSKFLLTNTRESELELFTDLSSYADKTGATDLTRDDGIVFAGERAGATLSDAGVPEAFDAEDLPMTVIIPAFVLSELKTAFQMGFLLFLPFLVIDLVVSSVLLSMGMFMLPPVMISTPIKVLVFVLVDGWHLICESVVTSFIPIV
jgi:flagellar biosynthesis protein FliP